MSYEQTDQDGLYIEDSYFTPDGYYVYVAEAQAAMAVQGSLSADVGVIKTADCTMAVSVTVTATISHIEGADLFAFSDAQLAAEVNRIRDNNVNVSAAFTQVTAGAKFIHFSSDQNIDSTISVANLRVRFNEAAVNAAFSLTADIEMIPGGDVLDGQAVLASEFTIDAKISRKQNLIDCDVNSEFAFNADGNRIRGLESTLLETTALDVTNTGVIRSADSALSVTASQTVIISHIEGADLLAFTNASQTTSANVIRNSSVGLTSNVSIKIDATAIKRPSYDLDALDLSSSISLSAQAIRLAGFNVETNSQINLTAQGSAINVATATLAGSSTVTVQGNEIVQLSSDLIASSTVTVIISHIEGADIVVNGFATTTVDANRFVGISAEINSTAQLVNEVLRIKSIQAAVNTAFGTTALGQITAVAQSNLNSSTTSTVSVEKIKISQISLNALSQLSVNGVISNRRPRQTTAFNGITTTTADKILGTHSLYKDASNKYLEVNASTDFNIGSGVDFAIKFYFKPTTGTGKILRAYDSANARDVWSFTNNGSSARFSYWDGSTTLNIDLSKTVTGWCFFGVNRTGSNLTFDFSNGSGASGSQTVTLSGAISSGTPVIQIGIPSTSALGYFDEFFMTKGINTYVSTNAGKDPTTQFLFHFDGNFTDDMTATLFGAAALSSTSTVSATARADKSAQASLSSNYQVTASLTGTQNAVIDISALAFQISLVGRVQSDLADLDSQFSLTANATRIKDFSIAVAATTSLSASALDLDLAVVNMSSQFSLSAVVREIPVDSFDAVTRSLLHFDQNKIDAVTNEAATGTVLYYGTSQTGFGNSAFGDGTDAENDGPQILVTRTSGTYSTDASTVDFSYDVRLHPWNSLPTTDPDVESEGKIFTLQDEDLTSPLGGLKFYNLRYATPTPTTLRIYVSVSYSDYSGSNLMSATVTSLTDNSEISFRQWHHVKIIRKNGVLYLYIDGIEKNSVSFGYNVIPSIEIGSSTFLGSLDESHWRIGRVELGNFTVPTSPYTVLEGYTRQGVSDLTSSSSLSAIGYRAQFAEASFASQTSVNIDGLRVRFSVATANSTFSQTTVGQKNAILEASLSSTITSTVGNSRTRDLSSSMSSSATLACEAIKVTVTQVSMSVTGQLASDANRIRDLDSAISSIASQISNAIKTSQGQSNFEVIATELAAVVRTGQGFVDTATVVATVTAAPVVLTYSTTNMTVVATQTTSVTSVRYAAADLAATSTAVIVGTYLRRNESIQTATATLTAQGRRVAFGTASMSTTAVMSTTVTRFRDVVSNNSVIATASISGGRVRLGVITPIVTSEFFATVNNLVRVTANLSVQAFELSAFNIIHLDPLNGLIIEPETRYLKINDETRILTINSETRVNKIKGYPQL